LGQVIVILAGQKSVPITSNNSFNVAIVDIEKEALHLVVVIENLRAAWMSDSPKVKSYLEPKGG
jgi:hypothetical protein